MKQLKLLAAAAGTILKIALLVMLGDFSIRAQESIPDFTQRVWTQRNGLPSNEVTGLSQNRSGYLYIGTPDGIARFDGRKFTPILYSAETDRQDRGFVAVVEIPDSDDLLIAPRSGGLLRLSGDSLARQPLPATFEHTAIEALFYENNHTLWIGFKGGAALRQEADNLQIFDTRDGLSNTHPIQFARDGAGRTWLASGSLLARYEKGTLTPVPVGRGKERLRIASARHDGPWVVADEHLCKFENGSLTEITKVNTSTGAYYIQALLEDSSGALWLGTRSRGLRRISPDPGRDVKRIIEAPEDISALIEDASGNIWAGSNGGGIIRVKPRTLKIYDRSTGLLEAHSLTVCEDDSGRMWFANRDGGIAFLNNRGRTQVIDQLRPLENFSAFSISPAKNGGVWASTTHGLMRVTGSQIQQRIERDILTGNDAPRVVLTAQNGDLWLALNPGGAARLRGGELLLFGPLQGLGPSTIRSLAEDPSGRIWTGAEDGSIHRLDGDGFSRGPLLPLENTGAIQAIHFDRAGTCWIGTQRRGLIRLDAHRAQAITTRDGLVSDNITQIISDDENAIWLGSPGAIFHVQTEEIERLLTKDSPRISPVIVGPDEGLAEATCLGSHQPSSWKSADGLLWFATRQGVVAIDPAKERKTITSLQTKIQSVRLDGLPQKPARAIHVGPHVHSVELHFSSLCLATPERVRTRYRLKGFDDDWVDAGQDGVAKYLRLPPGRYDFEVSAHLAGVSGRESTDTINIEIEAAWWQTPWFLLAGIALVILALVAAVRRWSHHRLHKKLASLEHESSLERERARIAKNIHDDLGAGLTRISLLTQSAPKNESEAQLDRIYKTVSELTQSMDEIVWALNPRNDDLESVANYIGEFAQGYLSDAGLRCRVLIPETLPLRTHTAQFRHHLFLGCKEALNNIVKHANASDVSLQLDVQGDALTLTITDNGTGIPSTPTRPGRNGLANMRSRMEAIGGGLRILPAQPNGTMIILSANLSSVLPSL